MKDQTDKQTAELPLNGNVPKKRGRPKTGKALSNAEKQRAYRERQKTLRCETGEIEQLKRGYFIECLEPRCKKWKRWSQHDAMSLYAAERLIRCLEGAEEAAKSAGIGGNKYRITPA